MMLVNKYAANTTRTRVQVFVRTPACKVYSPVVQLKWNITNSMCKVEAGIGTNFVCCFRYTFHVEQLTGVVVYTTHHHQDQRIAGIFNCLNNVVFFYNMYTFFWF